MVQPLYSFLRCFALLPTGKNGTIDTPEAMNLQNGPKSWALEKVRIVQVRVHSLKLT